MLISEFLHNITTKALEALLKAEGIGINKSPDFIIEKPKNSDFGEKFIKLSRDVHFLNDDRAKIKLEINNKKKLNINI